MQKVKNLRRVYTDKAVEYLGETILKGLMVRSLKVAQSARSRHLVSGFLGYSVYVVTHQYGNGGVKQTACMPDELTADDREALRSPAFKKGYASFSFGTQGEVLDASDAT